MKSFTDFILLFFKQSNRGRVHIPFLINKKISLLIVSIFLLFTSSGNAIDSPFNFKFEVNKINYQNGFIPSSPHGFITVSFTPGQEGKFLSVLAENNSENVSGFIVENMFLPPIGEADSIREFSTVFLLSAVSVSLKLPITLTLTAYITDFPDYFPFVVDSIAKITTVDAKEMIYNVGDVVVPQIQVEDAPFIVQPQPVGDTLRFARHRDDVDNIDLDSSAHPPTSTYAGDDGACAPAATANSFKWLEKKYEVAKLPQDMTLRKTLERLSSLMGRPPNRGPHPVDMIKAKLDFMVQFNLLLNVRFQCVGIDEDVTGFFGDTAKNVRKKDEFPSWDFLKQMMQEGEDVEINYTWIDQNTGKFDTVGHSVVITGVQEFSSGKKEFLFKHDSNQRCPGGLREEFHPVTTDSTGWLRFGYYSGYYITCIIAESPDRRKFSQRTTVYVNEFQTLTPSETGEFIEVVANKNIPNLQKFKVTVYNGSGVEVINTTLDEFTAGESADNFTIYTYNFSGNILPDQQGAIGLALSGSPIPESFVSWGGAVTAVNGDCIGLTSSDLGIAAIAGHSYALAGTGTAYDDFQWVSSPDPSPGMLNSLQTTPVELTSSAAPLRYELAQNYPNPFNPISNFGFRIADFGSVTLKVYDVLGNEIATLVNEEKSPGAYNLNFDASNLSSGVYYYTLKAGSFVETKKMVVLK